MRFIRGSSSLHKEGPILLSVRCDMTRAGVTRDSRSGGKLPLKQGGTHMSTPGTDNCHVERLDGIAEGDAPENDLLVLRVSGMGSVRCANRVRNALALIDGVRYVNVDFTSATVVVRADPSRVAPRTLARTVAAAGAGTRHRYEALVLGKDAAALLRLQEIEE